MENYNRVRKSKFVTCYYLDKKLHRIGGPAEEWNDGTKFWYQNGLEHRVDGPAKEYSNGSKEWWFEGKRHKIDGPAIEYTDGAKSWWIEGKQIECNSQEEFERLIKLKLFW